MPTVSLEAHTHSCSDGGDAVFVRFYEQPVSTARLVLFQHVLTLIGYSSHRPAFLINAGTYRDTPRFPRMLLNER